MKTLSIFLLASLTSLTINAQQLINQKDPFTGKQVKVATVTLGGAFKNIGQIFAFTETDEKRYVSFLWMPGMSEAKVEDVNFNNVEIKNCSLLLNMDDDSVIKFKADTLLSKKGGSGTGATLGISSYISDAQLQFLMSHTIKIIRLGLTNDNLGVDAPFLTDKFRKQIQKAASYMLDANAK
jgi:hypothetical protein